MKTKKKPPTSAPKSLEEVILRRRLEDQAYALSVSSSMPILPPLTYTPDDRIESRLHRTTSLKERENRYSEEDVRKMVEDVMKYCRSLQNRVQDLEVQLLQESRNKSNSSALVEPNSFSASRTATVRFADFTTAMDPFDGVDTSASPQQFPRSSSMRLRPLSVLQQPSASQSLVKDATQASTHLHSQMMSSITNELVVDIDQKVAFLKEIFKKTDPMELRRLSAIKIQALIRKFLARARLQSFKTAMRDWRWMRCRPVIWLLDILLANQSKFDSGFHLLTMNRTMRTLVTVFSKWAIVCRQNAPMRYQIRELAQEKIERKRFQFIKTYFEAFKAVTTGRISLRQANQQRKEMIDKIRKDLSDYLREKGLIGIVPPHEIQKMLHRRVIDEFKLRKRSIVVKGIFNRFKKLVAMAKKFELSSKLFRFRRLAGRCFYAWSDHTYLCSLGLDRKRWPAPRKYEVKYNQKRVDNFSRLRCERLIFSAWKAYFQVQLTVKRKFQRKLSEFISSVFHGWKKVSTHSHRLRRLSYENWIGYSKLMVEKPFKAWADHVRAMKNRYKEHARIAKSYYRWKERQKMLLIVKVWRHQALFGRIDGLYTRQMLLKTVADQKIFVTSLEKTMADQTMELEECKQMVLAEIDKKNELEAEIQRLNQENNKLKMANHNYEQELKRLESVIQAMIVINPKQMEHLKKMQPEFKFKERNIALSEGSSSIANTIPDRPPTSADPATTKDSSLVQNETEGTAVTGGPSVPPASNIATDAQSLVSENESVNSANKIGPLVSEEGSVNSSLRQETRGTPNESLSATVNNNDSTSLEIETKFDERDDRTQANQVSEEVERSHVPTAEHSPMAVTPHANSEPDPSGFHFGPTMSLHDQRLLERVNWVIHRYKHAWPPETLPGAEVLPGADSTNQQVDEGKGEAVPSNSNDGMGENNYGASYDSALSFSGQYDPQRQLSFASVRSNTRNSLLRGSNPFLRIDIGVPSRGEGSFLVPPSPTVASLSNRQPSISMSPAVHTRQHGMGSFRTSFSRNMSSAIAAAVQAVENSPIPMDAAPNPYYSDHELEEIVILWAKMLFTILEFLETGDITNLPKEDKRLWAEHLLEQSRHASEVPYDALYEREEDSLANHQRDAGSLTSGLTGSQAASGAKEDDNQSVVSTDTEKIARAVADTTMITVDQVQVQKSTFQTFDPLQSSVKAPADPVTWREGLLRLRTMFPGAGNFSGFGVGIEAPEDTALFQRLLRMREDLRKIENVQTLRYQRQFYESQKLSEQQTQRNVVTTPSGKKVKAFKPSASPSRGGEGSPARKTMSQGGISELSPVGPPALEGEESLAGLSLTSSVEPDNSSLRLSRPLGTNIYAGNLRRALAGDDK